MSEWLTPACQWLGPEAETALAMVCAVLGALLFTVIVLGFGPLRTWFGLDDARGLTPKHSDSGEAGLLATWRLYQQLGRTDPTTVAFAVPDVPTQVVPNTMVERAQDVLHLRDLVARNAWATSAGALAIGRAPEAPR